MLVSLNWIKDYVKLPDDMDLKKLAYDLTMSTVEVEDAEELAKRFEGIVVGVIKEVLPHPNADKLRVCRTDIGGGEIKEIVCGGKGCSVCKQVGWIEVMPGGTPHPNVLRAAGLDPDEYTGFYVNIGLDRLVMMRYGVDDVRLFNSADLRFLEQFR